jgi:hypothetical protein
VAGAVLLGIGLPRWLGWGLVLLGGVWALVLLRSLGEEQERLVIDDAGIRDSLLPVGIIGWDEVRGASVQEIGGVGVVALKVRDPERFIRRLPAAGSSSPERHWRRICPGSISLWWARTRPAEIAEAISQRARFTEV